METEQVVPSAWRVDIMTSGLNGKSTQKVYLWWQKARLRIKNCETIIETANVLAMFKHLTVLKTLEVCR